MTFSRENYLLAFWAQGVSAFVTDIHVDVYRDLEVLFLIDEGMFKQYFPHAAFERALDRGFAFYADEYAYGAYKRDLEGHCDTFREFFTTHVENKQSLSKATLQIFFAYTIQLCKQYTWMNFEHTDRAFSEQDTHPIIKANLTEAAKYKDVVRTFMNEVLFETGGYVNTVFRILQKKFRIDHDNIENLTQKEILELYEGVRPAIHSVGMRQKAFVINFDRSVVSEGNAAEKILQEFRPQAINSTAATGKTASLGKANGPVKVINVDYTNLNILYTEIDKMNHGDILIAETTAPELILACKKAAAIVTDVGGMLSHAAIVSREFGIPCIVGTENATRIFKDGDMVEVRAEIENGVVTKL
jgi:phosphohistidine swiveling domain-containing protein